MLKPGSFGRPPDDQQSVSQQLTLPQTNERKACLHWASALQSVHICAVSAPGTFFAAAFDPFFPTSSGCRCVRGTFPAWKERCRFTRVLFRGPRSRPSRCGGALFAQLSMSPHLLKFSKCRASRHALKGNAISLTLQRLHKRSALARCTLACHRESDHIDRTLSGTLHETCPLRPSSLSSLVASSIDESYLSDILASIILPEQDLSSSPWEFPFQTRLQRPFLLPSAAA